MPYFRGMGDAAAPGETQEAVIARIDERVAGILKSQQDDARFRKYALYVGFASALFAAAKFGIIALPHIRKMRQGGDAR